MLLLLLLVVLMSFLPSFVHIVSLLRARACVCWSVFRVSLSTRTLHPLSFSHLLFFPPVHHQHTWLEIIVLDVCVFLLLPLFSLSWSLSVDTHRVEAARHSRCTRAAQQPDGFECTLLHCPTVTSIHSAFRHSAIYNHSIYQRQWQ